MTLSIQSVEDEQRQLRITVEVPEERVQASMRRVAKKLARDINIPGFRRGKVPYQVLVRRVGEDALRSEAVDELLNPVFEEVLDEVDAVPYAPANLEDVEMKPLVIKFVLPLTPQIELGPYRELRRDVPEVNIADEAVAEELQRIRERHASIETVDRPVQAGDIVALGGSGQIAGDEEAEPVFDEERIDFTMDPDVVYFGAPFVDAIVGMSADEEKQFSITLPEDFEDDVLAGKSIDFSLTVLEVKERTLPELDDELAKDEGDFETLEELRAHVSDRLENAAEQQARDEFFDAFMTDVQEQAEIVYPPAAIERELDDMIASFKDQITRQGWKWEDYLRLESKTEESLREEWTERAENRLARGLILHEFMHEEMLEVTDDELNEAIEERLARFEDEETRQMMRDFLAGESGGSMIGNDLLMDKIYERMVAIVTGSAPDLAELVAASAENDGESE